MRVPVISTAVLSDHHPNFQYSWSYGVGRGKQRPAAREVSAKVRLKRDDKCFAYRCKIKASIRREEQMHALNHQANHHMPQLYYVIPR